MAAGTEPWHVTSFPRVRTTSSALKSWLKSSRMCTSLCPKASHSGRMARSSEPTNSAVSSGTSGSLWNARATA